MAILAVFDFGHFVMIVSVDGSQQYKILIDGTIGGWLS